MSEAVAEPKDDTGPAEGAGPGGFLGWIERAGNRVPHPAIIFLALIVIVIVLSAVLAAFDVKVDHRGRRAQGHAGLAGLHRRRIDVSLDHPA